MPSEQDPDAVFIEAGAFKVDRGRALEKLKERQLAKAQAFLLPLIRCAALSKATAVSADKTGEGVRLSFDGEPLPESLLRDPYRALFEEKGPESERGRELAVGLLAGLRVSSRVVIFSGEGPKRLRVEISSPEKESVGEGGPGTGIVIEARLSGMSAGDVLACVSGECRLLEASLTVGGRPVLQGPDLVGLPALSFKDAPRRGFMVIRPRAGESVIHLYKQGVRVCSVTKPWLPEIEVHVNDDAFKLDASQAKVVQDERLEAATGSPKDRMKALAEVAAEKYRIWVEGYGRGGPPESVFSGKIPRWQGGGVLREACLTGAWLRDAAAKFLPQGEALWTAQLYLSADGRPLTLREIDKQFQRMKLVPVSGRFEAETDKETLIVWRTDREEKALEHFFRKKVVRWRYAGIPRKPSPWGMLLGVLLALAGFALLFRSFPSAVGASEPRDLLEFGLLAVLGGCFLAPGALIFFIYGLFGGGMASRYFSHEIVLPFILTMAGATATLWGLNPPDVGRLTLGFLVDVAAALLWTRTVLRLWRDR